MRRPEPSRFTLHPQRGQHSRWAAFGHRVADDSKGVCGRRGHVGGERTASTQESHTGVVRGAAARRFEPFDRPGQGDARTVYLPEARREAVPPTRQGQGLSEVGGRPAVKGPEAREALPERRRPSDPPTTPPSSLRREDTEAGDFREAQTVSAGSRRQCFGNDPSAGSPTETLLRLLLPLNDQV